MYKSSRQEFQDNNISYNNNVVITMLRHIQNPLMQETYSKPCQISKMIRHIENLRIVRTVCSGILRYIKAYWGICRHYWGILSDSQTNSELCNLCMHNCAILRTRGSFKILPNMMFEHWIFRDIRGYWCIFIHTHRCATR